MTNDQEDHRESVQQFLQKVNLARMYQLWGRMVEASDLCHQALTLIPTSNKGTCPEGFLPSGSSRPSTSNCDKNNGGGVVILNRRLEDLGLNGGDGDDYGARRRRQKQRGNAMKWKRQDNLIVTSSRPKTATTKQQKTKKKRTGVAVKYIGYYRALKDRR